MSLILRTALVLVMSYALTFGLFNDSAWSVGFGGGMALVLVASGVEQSINARRSKRGS